MSDDSKRLALDIVEAARSRKATDIVALEVRSQVDYADYLVICSGRSDRQVGAIADAIDQALSANGTEPLGIEGKGNRRWVLMDYAGVVVHIFHEELRPIYDLERLWFDAPQVPLPDEEPEVPRPVGGI